MSLLTTQNAKTIKGENLGYLTAILYLNPKDYDLCPMSTKECRTKYCLVTAGRGNFKSVKDARTRKTEYLLEDRASFLIELAGDIAQLNRKAKKQGLKLAVRLNGTSDLPWYIWAKDIMKTFSDVVFYDYTKVIKYWEKSLSIDNYHVTFSHSETNRAECNEVLERGGQVATISSTAIGIDGDKHDLRFLDSAGLIVLSPKGDAKKQNINLMGVAA